MPELPEVETILRDLRKTITHRKITSASVHRTKLRCPVPAGLACALLGKTILEVVRRAKYILIKLDNGFTLLIHLGMAGKLLFSVSEPPLVKHDHLRIELDQHNWLVFRDPRCFGTIDLLPTDTLSRSDYLANLGPEPFSSQFTVDYLANLAQHRRIAVKLFLLDQKIVAGIGNIYASEILFRLGVLPTMPVNQLTRQQLEKLVKITQEVLRLAIEAAGTSLRDYVKADGSEGAFQRLLYVYGRAKLPCKVCRSPIQVVKLSGRSSFYCSKCQTHGVESG